MKIVYTFKARQDLKDIYEYITYTLFAPDAAKNTTDKITETVRGLENILREILFTRMNLGTVKVCGLYL